MLVERQRQCQGRHQRLMPAESGSRALPGDDRPGSGTGQGGQAGG
jgi:hypothetical protein